MQRVVGIGHSHLEAVSAAFNEYMARHPGRLDYRPVSLADPRYDPFFLVDGNGATTLNAAGVAAIRDALAGGEATMFLYLGGSEHWRWSLTPGPDPFDVIDPVQDDGQPPIGRIVPYELFIRNARAQMEILLLVVDLVRGLTPGRLVQVLPPPPLLELPLDRIPTAQREAVEGLVGATGISPPAFRLKLWRIVARAMTDTFATRGVECIPAPAAAVRPDGFLRWDMMGDLVHGNIGWGRLIAGHLLAGAGGAELAA